MLSLFYNIFNNNNNNKKVYYKLLLPSELSECQKEELITKLFRLFDIDTDGYLNYSEFLVSFWIRCRAPIREKFTWIFNMLDLDHNGSLNYTEIRAALSLCLNQLDLNDLLRQLNHDAASTKKLKETGKTAAGNKTNNKRSNETMKERFLKTFFCDTEEEEEENSRGNAHGCLRFSSSSSSSFHSSSNGFDDTDVESSSNNDYGNDEASSLSLLEGNESKNKK